MAENAYQRGLIRRIQRRFPGCELLKNDANYRQGVPDWTLFWGPYWAMLEIKDSPSAREQPNQDYYVKQFNEMGFAAFIYPENEEEVLAALEQAFASRGAACVPQP
jgi:hypothetical protein